MLLALTVIVGSRSSCRQVNPLVQKNQFADETTHQLVNSLIVKSSHRQRWLTRQQQSQIAKFGGATGAGLYRQLDM